MGGEEGETLGGPGRSRVDIVRRRRWSRQRRNEKKSKGLVITCRSLCWFRTHRPTTTSVIESTNEEPVESVLLGMESGPETASLLRPSDPGRKSSEETPTPKHPTGPGGLVSVQPTPSQKRTHSSRQTRGSRRFSFERPCPHVCYPKEEVPRVSVESVSVFRSNGSSHVPSRCPKSSPRPPRFLDGLTLNLRRRGRRKDHVDSPLVEGGIRNR